jgi:replicative DNA helicase
VKQRPKKHLTVVRDRRHEGICADLLLLALSWPSIAMLVIRDLAPGDFREADRPIFEALKETFERSGEINSASIADRTGWGPLSALLDRPPHVTIDGAHNALREIRKAKAEGEIMAFVRSGDYPAAGSMLSRLGAFDGAAETIPGRITDSAIEGFLALSEENRKRGFLGPKTGIQPLDKITLGMAPGSVWAVSGATSAGKTTLLSQVIMEVILQGASVAIFSLEMPVPWVLARLAGTYLRKNPTRIFMGELEENERTLLRGTLGIFRESSLFVFRDATELSEITGAARKIKAAHGRLDLVVVDFIQNVRVRDAGAQMDRMATAAIEFQRLAGETNACLLIASQLSNEAVREKGGGILSFRYAAELAHASDVAIELVPKTDGAVDLLVRKNRSGRLGSVRLRWADGWSRFEVG